ncbi:MAG: KdsC family phosphatase [Lachnospira sp.]
MKKIKYLIMDVDGTLTDGKIYISDTGELMKSFSVKDGYGIHDIAMSNGIDPVILTSRKSNIVMNRCKELGISKVYQGVKNKVSELSNISNDFDEMAYIGDDLNDLECMRIIKDAGGVVGCPKNAAQEVIKISDFVSSYEGGDGAVREYIEWILENRNL